MNNSASKPLKVGLVGCGGIAQIIHLPILTRLSDVEVVALCDMDMRKASIVANKFSIPHAYEDIEEMLRSNELELVFILTPNNLHLPMSLIALRHGSHLFIEKPAAKNSQEAQRIARAALKHQRQVMVGMQNRFRSDIQAIKSFLDAGELGEIFFAKMGWLQAIFRMVKQTWLFQKNISGGGVLMDLGIQLIDLIWWLNNKPDFESVNTVRYQIRDQIEVEDFLAIFLKFQNNLSVAAEFSWDFPINKDRFYLEIFGQRGTCTLNPLRVQKVWNGQLLNITPEAKESSQSVFKKAYEHEITHYINFLCGRVSSLESDIQDAIKVLEMTDAIYLSMQENREIRFKNGTN